LLKIETAIWCANHLALCIGLSLSAKYCVPGIACMQPGDMSAKTPAKKKDDAAFDVEQQFILRLPPVNCYSL